MKDKRMTPQEMVAQIRDGDTVAIGGWGPFSKPMTLVREIVKSDLKDLTIMSFAGIDVDMLLAAGKVKKLVFAFVSLDAPRGIESIHGLALHFALRLPPIKLEVEGICEIDVPFLSFSSFFIVQFLALR